MQEEVHGHDPWGGLALSLMCAQLLSCFRLFLTPWTVSLPGCPVHGIFQAIILEWVAMPFSRGSFWPRDQTRVLYIAGRFFTIWATREAQCLLLFFYYFFKIVQFFFFSPLRPWVSEVKSLSHFQLFVTPWTVAHQAPPSMGFSRQEYWSGLSFPSPGDLPNPGIEPRSPALQADVLTALSN